MRKKYITLLFCLLFLIGCKEEREEPMLVGNEVDMGLSVIWSDINVGAKTKTDYGNRYSWGELSTKNKWEWVDYKLYLGFENGCKSIADISNTEYDVAKVKWGGGWRMPTRSEFYELLQCESKYTNIDGVNGYLFTADNGNSVFLPSAGTSYSTITNYTNYGGLYWTSNQSSESKAMFAYALQFGPGKKIPSVDSYNKNAAMCIRPVKDY